MERVLLRVLIGHDLYEKLRTLSIDIYRRAADHASTKGVILADTKFEFGFAGDDLLLIDEVLTPDSSRYWPADRWTPGQDVPSFDKQYRPRLAGSRAGWDHSPPAPPLPDEVIAGTRDRYIEAYERITGTSFAAYLRGSSRSAEMRVKVEIVRRPEIADPQGVTVVRALRELGFGEVAEARFNRTIVLDVDATDVHSAKARVEEMCRTAPRQSRSSRTSKCRWWTCDCTGLSGPGGGRRVSRNQLRTGCGPRPRTGRRQTRARLAPPGQTSMNSRAWSCPGGFAHGDYLRTGAIARFSPIMGPVGEMAAAGRPVLGICNGFQILCEAGLLPGAFIANSGLSFICRFVEVEVASTNSILTQGAAAGQVLRLPLNSYEGNYVDPSLTGPGRAALQGQSQRGPGRRRGGGQRGGQRRRRHAASRTRQRSNPRLRGRDDPPPQFPRGRPARTGRFIRRGVILDPSRADGLMPRVVDLRSRRRRHRRRGKRRTGDPPTSRPDRRGIRPDPHDAWVAIPRPAELAMYSVMWSEHCSYKSSRVHLGRLPTTAPWVVVGPGENAGVVDIGDGWLAALRIESHNHPSLVEPYQGAATGVGGILRDIFTMGARPIALWDSLRFGPLDQPRNRYLFKGVVAGIAGYGNAVGVPTVGGELGFR